MMTTTRRPEIYAVIYGDITTFTINIWLERYEKQTKKQRKKKTFDHNPYPYITTTFDKETATHIVIDPEVAKDKMITKIYQVTGMTLQQLDAENIKIVKSSWIFNWLEKETIVDVAPYLVKYNNDNITKPTEQEKKKQKRSENDSNDSQNDLPGLNDSKKNVKRSKMGNSKQAKNIEEYSKTKEYYKQRNILIKASTKYEFDPNFSPEPYKKYEEMFINICDEDTVHHAIDMKYNSLYNPLILNMANAKTPGGGVLWGAMAQEESIFYRSYYHSHLLESLYPISDLEAIYSKGVDIRDSGSTFMPTHTPRDLDFIASAAIKKPKFDRVWKILARGWRLSEGRRP